MDWKIILTYRRGKLHASFLPQLIMTQTQILYSVVTLQTQEKGKLLKKTRLQHCFSVSGNLRDNKNNSFISSIQRCFIMLFKRKVSSDDNSSRRVNQGLFSIVLSLRSYVKDSTSCENYLFFQVCCS